MNFTQTVSGIVETANDTIGSSGTSVLDKLKYGAEVMIIGMGTVFSVLIILWFILTVFNLIYKIKNQPSKAQNANPSTPVTPEPVAPVAVEPADISEQEDESDLVAVIMASVYAASGAQPGSLRMVSYKRQKTPWNRK